MYCTHSYHRDSVHVALDQHSTVFYKLTNGGQSCDTATGVALNLGIVRVQLHNEGSQCTRLHNGSLVLS